jgi:SAM-dependent methyltransferase
METMADELPVWTYWEGPCPDYIKMSVESIQRWCNARVLNRQDFDKLWQEDRDLPIDSLYVAQRADFIRVYLLLHYGGAWIDADCIVLKSIAPHAAHLGTYDLVAYREPQGTITNNFLIATAHSPIMHCYYEGVVSHLRERRPISWLEIGSVPLTAAIQRYPGAAQLLSSETIMPISWTESRRFLDQVPPEALNQAAEGRGTVHDPCATCYMLSNHSMPQAVKAMSRTEILSGATFLAYLFRLALFGTGVESIAPNYRYWRTPGTDWAAEYARRKTRHPYYHIQEMMITDHVAHHAPCRVLEWGCGAGRHLCNLCQVQGVEVYGFDQSQAMIDSGLQWASREWRTTHVIAGSPTGTLPYEDKSFEIVFSCEALLHTRPDDLHHRLRELVRVCRGHILHLEVPPSWSGYSPSCHGCWGHDFMAAYKDLGYECEVLPSGFTRQVPYRVCLQPESLRWTWNPAMLSIYQRLEADLEQGFADAGVPAMA